MSTIKTNQLAHTANGAATYTLPQTDGSAGQVLKTDGSGNLSWVTLPSQGLAMVDTWRLTTDISNAQNTDPEFITANLERDDTSTYSSVGTGMTESSGVFTFPATGIYYIIFTATGNVASAGGDNWSAQIHATLNNSSYVKRSQTYTGVTNNSRHQNATTSCLVDVTDTSNVKVKLAVGSVAGSAGSSIYGNTDTNFTHAMFMKVGDT